MFIEHSYSAQSQDREFLEASRSLEDLIFLQNLYRRYLYRELDPSGKDTYLNKIREGVSREQILHRIKNAKGYNYAQKIAGLAKNVEVISIHIPKTAGTAFNNILSEVYEKNCLGDANYSPKQLVDDNLIHPNTKAIFGHIPARKYYYYLPHLPKAKLVTWLREPIHRLISWYCYCISMPPESFGAGFQTTVNLNRPSFMDFAKMPEARNAMSRQLQGVNLSDFYFIGFQDSFESDISSLSNMLNWQKPRIKPANKNKHGNYQNFAREILSDRNNVKLLHSLNADDMQLYQEAISFRNS